MIKAITISSLDYKVYFATEKQDNKIVIDCSELVNFKSFNIEIEFIQPIIGFKNHDYTWVDCTKNRIANEYSPKIIKFANGTFIQPNSTIGIWEVNKNSPKILFWRFNTEDSKPLTIYSGESNKKIIAQANVVNNLIEQPTLLFTKNPIEFSRSKTPFSAITCFTDHCDFDTFENLKLQRDFFKKYGIKITKGFFLNHFSKREDNASYEKNQDEILKWKKDGHELCYHSLSQSIKSDEESFKDFYNFKPPFSDSQTWIDHGYQPYNFSLFQNNKISTIDFETNLSEKNITTLWNYIDSGTSTTGVLNQLNTNHFTLKSFLKGNQDLSFVKKIQLMIKNIIFHYYGDEELILKYKSTATNFKKFISKKKPSYFFLLIKDMFLISNKIISVFLFWNIAKNKPYKLAKYSPILFKHKIEEKEFNIFQTIEMLDFKKSLSHKNIDDLIQEKGIFIAHTYFSVPMEYHRGKMFVNEHTIDDVVAKNFEYLGNKIKNSEIWNPTLQELISYWSNFQNLVLDVDNQGIVFVKNGTELCFRIAN